MNQESVIRSHYNQFADKYDEVKPSGKRNFSRLNGRSASVVLDVGCATGNLLFYLSHKRAFHRGIGIDLSEKALNIARTHAQDLRPNHFSFLCASACHLPFTSQYFDAVISNAVFHLIPDQRKALEEVVRVLKPAGVAIIQFPGGGDIEPELFDLLREAWDETVPHLKLPDFFYMLTIDKARQYLIDLGIDCFEISCKQSKTKIREADIDGLVGMFHLVGSLWRWGINSHTAVHIEQLVAAEVVRQISSQGYFSNTRNHLLIEITKPA